MNKQNKASTHKKYIRSDIQQKNIMEEAIILSVFLMLFSVYVHFVGSSDSLFFFLFRLSAFCVYIRMIYKSLMYMFVYIACKRKTNYSSKFLNPYLYASFLLGIVLILFSLKGIIVGIEELLLQYGIGVFIFWIAYLNSGWELVLTL